MPLGPLPLQHTPEQPAVWLRELSGADEAAVRGTSPVDTLALLDRVLERDATPGPPVRAAALSVPDRDRVLASLYVDAYGSLVASVVRCGACQERFDVEFSLLDVQASLDQRELPPDVDASGEGVYRLKEGVRFRLPTGEDQMAVAGLPLEEAERELLSRCVLEGDGAVDGPVEEAMETLGPVLDLDLTATCPECEHQQPVRFEIEHYLLSALLRDRPALLGDVHRLARAYGWSPAEILDLPRNERRRLVELVESEHIGRRKVLG